MYEGGPAGVGSTEPGLGTEPAKDIGTVANRTCSIEGCEDPHKAHGWCHNHYMRWRRWGDPLGTRPARPLTCTFSGCESKYDSSGYCAGHARQLRLGQVLKPILGLVPPPIIRRYTLNEAYFDEVTTPQQAYWLGFITADGSITRNAHESTLTLELAKYDAGHLLKFARDVGTDAPVRETRRDCARIRVGSSHLMESLAALGVTERKSLVVEPPLEKLRGLERYYWRGLWDGDGHISQTKARHPQWTIGLVGSRACVDGFASWARPICGSRAECIAETKNPLCWKWAVGGAGKSQRLAEELRLAGMAVALDRKQVLLEAFCAIDLIARKAQIDAGRAVKMRDAWATGRHSRA